MEQFLADGEKIVKEKVMNFYEEYDPTIYKRMGRNGGILSAVTHESVGRTRAGYSRGVLTLDPNLMRMDTMPWPGQRGRRYGRHTNANGSIDLRASVLKMIEEGSIRGKAYSVNGRVYYEMAHKPHNFMAEATPEIREHLRSVPNIKTRLQIAGLGGNVKVSAKKIA